MLIKQYDKKDVAGILQAASQLADAYKGRNDLGLLKLNDDLSKLQILSSSDSTFHEHLKMVNDLQVFSREIRDATDQNLNERLSEFKERYTIHINYFKTSCAGFAGRNGAV